ncbi:hypothetical protein Mgra_00002139 [Meloidogyne graminicola]|uniref:Uncharacterized protein n=1 Tax=Meloidogyne graminicola TaxID=189291 RepID=A0A8S9ZYR9_9BILA|nr:hypothetical protein Mgra_00002139 [Meloidogyne graminicola]
MKLFRLFLNLIHYIHQQMEQELVVVMMKQLVIFLHLYFNVFVVLQNRNIKKKKFLNI